MMVLDHRARLATIRSAALRAEVAFPPARARLAAAALTGTYPPIMVWSVQAVQLIASGLPRKDRRGGAVPPWPRRSFGAQPDRQPLTASPWKQASPLERAGLTHLNVWGPRVRETYDARAAAASPRSSS